MMSERLKIGVAGAGHLGNIHLKCLAQSACYDIKGIYEVDKSRAGEMSESHGVPAFDHLEDLLNQIDVLDVVTPTPSHFEIAAKAIAAGKHVFIEKPVTTTVQEALELKKMQDGKGLKIQIGHVERFNPAILALKGHLLQPGFIEGHRLASFNPRGTDVSVVLDLMIHDLDLILKLVNSHVVDIQSKRVSVVSPTDDICNTRLTFANGCVANLTASRISLNPMRKMRLFQDNAYISIDLLEKQTQIISLSEPDENDNSEELLDTYKGPRKINMYLPEIKPVNAILMELETFYQCIKEDTTPYVSLEDGIEALDLAYKILEHGK